MKKITAENQQLFEELKKYEKGSKAYDKIYSKIILQNEALVGYIVKKFQNNYGYIIDDLFSSGKYGLMKAVWTFNPDKGLAFATYAARCVENEILMQIRRESKLGGGIVVSLNSTISQDKDFNELELEDILASDVDVEADVVDDEERESQIRELYKFIDKLPPKQAQILKLRYLSGDGDKVVNQKEVAKILGLNQAYISRIEKRAIKNLKTLIETGELKVKQKGGQVKEKPKKEVAVSTLVPRLKKIVKTKLSKRQAEILKKVYFTTENATQVQIANELGVMQQAVSNMKLYALKKLLGIYNQENPKNPLTKDRLVAILEEYKNGCVLKAQSINMNADSPRAILKNLIVSNLTKRQSIILLMLFYADVERKNIAELLELNISTINTVVFDGINKIQKEYNKIFKASLTVEGIRNILEGCSEEIEG